MLINAIFDPSVANAPAGYRAAIQAAIDWFDSLITNNITVTISFGWGEVNGRPLDPQAVGESAFAGIEVSYQQLFTALSTTAVSPDQHTAAASLPASDPTGGHPFFVTSAEAKALQLPAGPGGVDGWVGLNAMDAYSFDPVSRISGGVDAIGVLKHEISEVLGRIAGLGQPNGDYAPLDLFRYSNGALQLQPGFGTFSIDRGRTNALPFNDPAAGGDAGDWGPSQQGDAFAVIQVGRGAISKTDLVVLNVLGYQLASNPPGPHLVSATPSSSGGHASITTPIKLVFDTPVALGSGTIVLTSTAGDRIPMIVGLSPGEVTASGTTITIAPAFGLHVSQTYSVVIDYDTFTDLQGRPFKGTAAGDVSFQTMTSAEAVGQWFASVLRLDSNAAENREAAAGIQISLDERTSAAGAVLDLIADARATSSVATLAYEFFTGKAPSAAGMDYLVSPTGPNPNNLNSAYYQSFNLENRYINFAVNLGKLGEGAPLFGQQYGSLSLFEATRQAYATIFGAAPSDAKLHALLDPTLTFNGATMTRADYFAYYGQDGANGIGTKAAMVGWLMAEAEKANIGNYALSNDAFLTDVALHNAPFGVDIIGHYNQPSFAFMPG